MSPQKQAVTIGFRSPGTQPPVFVAGTFSGPQWEPYELEYETDMPDHDGGGPSEYRFFKAIEVPAGEYQYKFRLGPGDWWMLHGTDHLVVTDDAGNRNNLLHVKVRGSSSTDVPRNDKNIYVRPLRNKEDFDQSSAWEVTEIDPSGERKTSNVNLGGSPDLPAIDVLEDHNAPNEMPQNTLLTSAVASKEAPEELADSTLSPEKHFGEGEALGSDPSKLQIEVVEMREPLPSSENGRNSDSAEENGAVDSRKVPHDEVNQIRRFIPKEQQADFPDGLEGEVGEDSHQSYNFPETNIHSHAPLLSHECLSCPEIAPHCHGRSSYNIEAGDCMHNQKDAEHHEPSEAEILDDPTIEMFPTEPMEILKRIATLHSELPEDDSVDDDISSPRFSPTFAGQPSPMFPHEMPVNALPTPRHSFDAGVDGASDPRPTLLSRRPGGKPAAAYQAGDSTNSFEEVKAMNEDEHEPLIKPEDRSNPMFVPRSMNNPSSEGVRRRATGVDILRDTASETDSSDSLDKSSSFLSGFLDAIFYWFGTCLFAFFGGKHRG